jgi:hypothetical protein
MPQKKSRTLVPSENYPVPSPYDLVDYFQTMTALMSEDDRRTAYRDLMESHPDTIRRNWERLVVVVEQRMRKKTIDRMKAKRIRRKPERPVEYFAAAIERKKGASWNDLYEKFPDIPESTIRRNVAALSKTNLRSLLKRHAKLKTATY